MVRAKKELPVESTPVVEPEPAKEEPTLNDTILLENIFELRFVDQNGIFYKLDGIPGRARGDYRLVYA